MAYVLAVGAALANALTTILQRMGVESAPAESTLRWGLMAYALRRKVWLAGFGFMIAAFPILSWREQPAQQGLDAKQRQ